MDDRFPLLRGKGRKAKPPEIRRVRKIENGSRFFPVIKPVPTILSVFPLESRNSDIGNLRIL
jgi:hypothetical protein